LVASALFAASLALTACGSGGTAKTQGGKTVVTFWQQKFEDYQ
jgi:ABC-type glycerol-3-phosphate transport system substrate-binding protein